jgi:hypothetical protein
MMAVSMMPRTRSLLRATAVLAALSLPFVGPLFSADAPASVSIAVTWDGLLHESTAAVLVTSIESRPVWENGRIYTYTRVHVDRSVAGDLRAGDDAWIRTMGGVVGKVGQIVEGEAAFAPGESSLLFVHPGPVGAFVVTARGQGQFPLVAPDPKLAPRVIKSYAVGMLVAPRVAPATTAGPRLAAEVLHDRPVQEAAEVVASAWAAAHAH